MVGRPLQKVYCSGFTRAGLRQGLKIGCKMKGYPLSDGKTFRCKYHGLQNLDRFNKAKYTDEARIKQIWSLKQFANYNEQQIKEYYYRKIKPRINKREKSIYYRRKASQGNDPFRNFVRRSKQQTSLSFQLDEVLQFFKEKSRKRSKNNRS